MNKMNFSVDISNRKVVVVYKHSRLSYAMERGSQKDKKSLQNRTDKITQELVTSHENNLRSIESIKNILNDLRIPFEVFCRDEIHRSLLANKLVISVGGDGTVLETSHYCFDSPILGVNSDPAISIGALCIAKVSNFRDVITEIYNGSLQPIPLTRLAITIDGKSIEPLAMNDVLFCHKNPAALSRFYLASKGITEAHRSSGIWISTPAGSTGGIYSCGAKELPIHEHRAIFRLREPYWSDTPMPKLLEGELNGLEKIIIRSTMTDGQIFIDGPHQSVDINLGESIEVGLAEQPLLLFDGERLHQNRQRIIEQRKAIREHF